MRTPYLFVIATLIAAIGALPSCNGNTDSSGTDSNTHWLERCDSDVECGELSCICGTCTKSCTTATSCETYGSQATCTMVSGCTDAAAPTACVVTCNTNADCDGASCEMGQCRKGSGSGSGGTGGAGGAGAGGTAGSGAIGGGMGHPCGPMDAHDSGLDCAAIAGYAWDGKMCRPITCSCTGSDCGGIFATANECDTAYSACLAQEGLMRNCTTHGECTLTFRNCCASCGLTQEYDVLALRVDSPSPLPLGLCNDGCPDCVNTENLALQPACIDGQCQVIDLTSYAACTTEADCHLRTKDCCECGGSTTPADLMSVNASFPSTPDWCGDVACDACLPDYGTSALATCATDVGMCTVAVLL